MSSGSIGPRTTAAGEPQQQLDLDQHRRHLAPGGGAAIPGMARRRSAARPASQRPGDRRGDCRGLGLQFGVKKRLRATTALFLLVIDSSSKSGSSPQFRQVAQDRLFLGQGRRRRNGAAGDSRSRHSRGVAGRTESVGVESAHSWGLATLAGLGRPRRRGAGAARLTISVPRRPRAWTLAWPCRRLVSSPRICPIGSSRWWI